MSHKQQSRWPEIAFVSVAALCLAVEGVVWQFYPETWRRYVDFVGSRFGGSLGGFLVALTISMLVVVLLWRRRRASRLLATCLIVSILVHMITVSLFSLWVLRQKVIEMVEGREDTYELSVGLPSLVESLISKAVREKVMDLAVPDRREFAVRVETEPRAGEALPKAAEAPLKDIPTRDAEMERPEAEPVSDPSARVAEDLASVPNREERVRPVEVARMDPLAVEDQQQAETAPKPLDVERVADRAAPADIPDPQQPADDVPIKGPERLPAPQAVPAPPAAHAAPSVSEALEKTKIVDVVTPVVMAAGMTVREGTVLAESAVAQPALALKWERPAPAPSKLPELPRVAREPAADTASAAPLSLAEQPTEVQRDRPDLTVKVEIEAVLRALAPPLDLPSRAPVVEASAESDARARSAPSAVDAPRLHPELSTAVPPARPEPVLGKGRARQASVGAMAAASRVASPKATPSPRIAEALLQVDADSGAMPILAPTGSVQPLPTAAATEVPRESVRPVTAGRAGDGPLPATVPRVTEPAPTAVPETWRKAAAGTLVGEAQWQAAERNIDVPRGALTHRAIGAPALPVMMPVAVPLVATDAAAGPAVGRPSESGLRAAPLAPARIGEALPSVAQTGVPRVPLDTAAASAVPTPHSMALATTGRSAALSTSQPAPVETGAPAPRASAVRTSAAIPVGDAMAVVVAADKASAAEPRTPLDTRDMAVVRAPQDAAVGLSVGVRPSVRVSSPAPPIGSSAPLVGPSVALPHQGAARALPETAIEASATVARGVRRQPVMSVAAPARVADPGLGDGVTERSNVSSGLAAVSISKATSAAPTGLAVGELRSSAPLAAPERSSAAGPLNMDVQSFGSAAPMVVESVVPREVVRRAMPSLVTAEIGSRPQSMSKEYMYRLRTPQKRREFIEELGGSEQTEQAVEEALAWLARAQSPDGRWDVDGFSTLAECGGGGDRADGDVAVTGLSLLAYLAAGYTRSEGAHKDTIRKGLDWLMAGQAANGDLRRGGQMYGQAMATAALCESVSLSADARLRDAAQRAVNFILAAQNPGLGWRYQPRDDDNDTSVVGWQVLALRSAQIAGITVPDKHYQWTGAWLDLVRKGSQGGLYSYKPGHGVTPVMTAEGWFCQLFMAGDAQTRGEGESMAYVMANLPSWSTDTPGMIHFYYWYYGTLALHLSGAEAFEEWNAALTGALLAGRRKDGPSAGSWDPVCQLGPRGGRIYATAIATLCLEVYYRYLPLYRED